MQQRDTRVQRDACVQIQKRDNCERRVFAPKHEVRVHLPSDPQRDASVQMQLCVFALKCETDVQQVAVSECDLHVSLQKRETRVQILGDPNSSESTVSSSPTPTADLRDYLTRKRVSIKPLLMLL